MSDRDSWKKAKDAITELAGEEFTNRQLDIITKLLHLEAVNVYNVLKHKIKLLEK